MNSPEVQVLSALAKRQNRVIFGENGIAASADLATGDVVLTEKKVANRVQPGYIHLMQLS